MNIDLTGIGIEIIKGFPNIVGKIRNWWNFNLPAGKNVLLHIPARKNTLRSPRFKPALVK